MRNYTSASVGNCKKRWSAGIGGGWWEGRGGEEEWGGGTRTYLELYTAVAVLVFLQPKNNGTNQEHKSNFYNPIPRMGQKS